MSTVSGLGDEDSKLVTLARAVRARNGAVEGAAVRDDTGRTYVATPVVLASTNERALEVIPLSVLREHAVDVPPDLSGWE